MPRGDGTGPSWASGTGRGGGRGVRGAGWMRSTSPRVGPGGYCVCPNCGARVSHQVGGKPCYNLSCPKCGAKMVRG